VKPADRKLHSEASANFRGVKRALFRRNVARHIGRSCINPMGLPNGICRKRLFQSFSHVIMPLFAAGRYTTPHPCWSSSNGASARPPENGTWMKLISRSVDAGRISTGLSTAAAIPSSSGLTMRGRTQSAADYALRLSKRFSLRQRGLRMVQLRGRIVMKLSVIDIRNLLAAATEPRSNE
jgi:hypothetical protein